MDIKDLPAIMESEARVFQMVQKLKQELKARVAAVPFRGEVISDGENGKPFLGILKASNLSTNWSPLYHIPKAQAQAVEYRLEKCTTTKAVCRALYDMMSCGYVKTSKADPYMGSSNGSDRTYLNKDTLAVLRNSEIGKYALAHPPQKENKQGAEA